ncbi:uncharacterized protein Ir47a [Drosophila virilis]|uniref:Ionotropic glutamate receptor C-terminal domain-containing protein n=1 Tax=Drosophila virilis TaxID=7244 RepID=B4LKD8_DROVI|nr:uncharacterized protein LOC6625234 [Drosophila virilis]EDW61729.1 uncharacterized protein Dvir_GJ20151 [Drosophila virilis]
MDANELLLCLVLATLCQSWPGSEIAAAIGGRRQDFLYNFVARLHEERPILLLLLLQRRRDNGFGDLQHWQADDWPVLRYDEHEKIIVRNTTREALALVCMRELSDAVLLTALAANFEGMREGRIVIWLQLEAAQVPQAFLDIIAQQAIDYHFYNILILRGTTEFAVLRMRPFPTPSYEPLLLNSTERIFCQHWRNFQGKTAYIISSLVPPNSFISRDPKTGKEYINGFCYNLLHSFAKHRNIKLIPYISTLNKSSPILYTPQIMTLINIGKVDIVANLQPFAQSLKYAGTQNTASLGMVSMFMVVPCGRELSIERIYRRLFPLNWLTWLLSIYLSFAVFETLATSVNSCLLERHLHFRYSKFCFNLTVLRFFLSQAAPTSHWTSYSLRQLLVQLSFFGLLIGTCFNAQLSTLLTKHPHDAPIQSYAELNASRLPVVFSWSTRVLIEAEYDASFFKRHVPNAVFMVSKDQADLILSLNTSYAYQTYSYLWNALDYYQKTYKRQILCKTNALHIAREFPVNTVVQRNSIYAEALDHFILDVQGFGIDKWLETRTNQDMLRVKAPSMVNTTTIGQVLAPLHSGDLNLLWHFLLIGHVIAVVVFIAELSAGHWERQLRNRNNRGACGAI